MDLKSVIRAQGPPDQKALPPHPALLDRSTPLVYRTDGGQTNRAAFGQRQAHQHLSSYGGHESIDWVVNCVRLIAETSSGATWGFEDKGVRLLNERGPLSPGDVPVADPLLVKLFNEPNPYMDWTEFIELTMIDYLLVGNSYWLKYRPYGEEQRPLALYRLAPPFVKIIPGPFGIEGYEYDVPGGKEPLKFDPEMVVHLRQANPGDPYLGLGAIQGGARMLDMELALVDTMATYFEKRATPSMIVQSDRRVPKDVFTKLKQQVRAFYGGSRNAGELMVLQAGLKATSISPSATEAAFENLTKLSRDRILALFRVPPPLLGVNDRGDIKINEAQRVFDTKTMRPLLDKLQRSITRSLVRPGWGLDFVIDYEYIMPVEERLKLASTFAAIPGVRLREVREYAGLGPLGDERDDWVLNLPGEDGTEEDHDGGLPDRNLAGEGGRPPNGENTARFPEEGESVPDKAEVSRKSFISKAPPTEPALDPQAALARLKEIEKSVVVEDPDSGTMFVIKSGADTGSSNSANLNWQSGGAKAPTSGAVVAERKVGTDVASRIKLPEDRLRSDREADIDALVAEAQRELSAAAHTLERGLLDAVEGKAGDSIYQRVKGSTAWTAFQSRVGEILERTVARAVQRAVLHQGREGRRPDGEVDYEDIAKSIVHRPTGLRTLTKTLKDRIAGRVLDLQKSGVPRNEFEAAVREAITGWQDDGAAGVALTEATHGYNEGTLLIAELSGATHVAVFDGDEHDEPCREANGQIWDIERARENRLEHPRCRRSFTPITANE